MKVKLLQNTALHICASAVRTCWQSQEKSDTKLIHNGIELEQNEIVCGEKDKDLINRVGNKFKHSSTLEHLTYTFYISGVSRALLQELARHRMASPSVKSTRYTLKELKDETPFISSDFDYVGHLNGNTNANGTFDSDRASKYLVFTDEYGVDVGSVAALENLRIQLKNGVGNDKAKYCLPESYKTELTWTINARSLQNFISLRSSKAALWEIRELANMIFDNLPEEHKYLFESCLILNN